MGISWLYIADESAGCYSCTEYTRYVLGVFYCVLCTLRRSLCNPSEVKQPLTRLTPGLPPGKTTRGSLRMRVIRTPYCPASTGQYAAIRVPTKPQTATQVTNDPWKADGFTLSALQSTVAVHPTCLPCPLRPVYPLSRLNVINLGSCCTRRSCRDHHRRDLFSPVRYGAASTEGERQRRSG